MNRVLVVGSTGAGKTTLARAIAERLAIPFHEMDGLAIIAPRWQENPRLLKDVSQISSGSSWIFDSFGHPQVRELLWTRADTIVWIDYSRSVVMRRVLRRSLARTLFRRRIFGGNRETVGAWFGPDHPVWWAWSQYRRRRADIASRCANPRFAPLNVMRFHSPRAARAWLDTVVRSGDSADADSAAVVTFQSRSAG
ncbi:AAA family ATPase [Streptomyces sp. NPDC046985]|uniref:AAA family ATPase n=1 Tax=Streptomyces sp. NPDC046985 TaxID=3155377 RepID=UPI0033D5F2F4